MAASDADVVATVGVVLNDTDIAKLAAAIQRALIPAIERIAVEFGDASKVSNNFAKTATKGFTKTADAVGEVVDKTTAYVKNFKSLEKNILDFAEALKEVKDAASVIATGVQRASVERKAIEDRAAYERLASARENGKLLAIEAQRTAQSQLIAERDAGKARLQFARFIYESLGRLQKAFGATVAGIARTSTSAISSTLGGIGRLFSRSNQDINTGLDGALRTREGKLRRSFAVQEQQLSRSAQRQRQEVEKINKQLSTGVAGAVTGRGVGGGVLGGVAGGIGIGALLTSGFERYSNLERINKQFTALTGNMETASALLEEVKTFAKQTPFDLVGVADLAKGFLAIGFAAENVIPAVKTVSDAVALTGGGVEELNRIQRAIGQVVSAGRLQGDELNQLAENLPGLNIRKILAQQLTGGDVPALIKMQEQGNISADMFVKGLLDGLAGDQRLVGASEDLAQTLGGRVANLKESFEDLGATLIGTIATPLKAAVAVANTVLASLAAFIRGEVSPALNVLRDALKGALAGLAALAAIKGTIQAFRLLGSAISLALTPLGLLVIAFATIGAAFNVLRTRSEAFRNAVDRVWGQVKELASALVDLVIPIFETVADTVVSLAVPAMEALVDFVTGRVVPAFRDLVTQGREVIERLLVPLRETLSSIRPFLQPAIDGFVALGAAIGSALSGDFSRLAGGAAAAAGGVVESAKMIGTAVWDALEPVRDAIGNFFSEVFTKKNFKNLLGGFLGLVEELGRILGTIVSEPVVVKALLAIAAFAGVVAIRFAKGFAEGVASNLPDLLSDIGNVLVDLLFNPKVILAAIAAVFAYTKLVQPIVSTFRRLGESAGGSFTAGLRQAAGGAKGFMQGLLAPGSLMPTLGPGRNEQREALRRRNELRIFQPATNVNLKSLGFADATKELDRLKGSLTGAQLAGLQFRDRMLASMAAVRVSMTGAQGVLGGLNLVRLGFIDAAKTVRAGFASSTSQTSSPFDGLRLRAMYAFDEVKKASVDAFGGVASGLATAGRAAKSTFDTVAIRGMYAFDKVKTSVTAMGPYVNTAFGGVVSGWKTATSTMTSATTRFGTSVRQVFERIGSSRIVEVGRQAGSQIATGFGLARTAISQSFRQTLTELKLIAASQGTSVGTLIGSKIAAGIGTAVGGVMAGQAAGGAGAAASITAVLGTAAAGFAVGGPAGAAVGAGAAAIGVAMGDIKANADKAKQSISNLSKTLETTFADALKNGATGAEVFNEALQTTLLDQQLLDEIGPKAVNRLADLGLTIEDVREAALEGGNAWKDMINNIAGGKKFNFSWDNIGYSPEFMIQAQAIEDTIERLGVAANDSASRAAVLGTTMVEMSADTAVAMQGFGDRINAGFKEIDFEYVIPDPEIARRKSDEMFGYITQDSTEAKNAIENFRNELLGAFDPFPTGGFQNSFNSLLVEAKTFGNAFTDEVIADPVLLTEAINDTFDALGPEFKSAFDAAISEGLATDAESLAALMAPVREQILAGIDDPVVAARVGMMFDAAILEGGKIAEVTANTVGKDIAAEVATGITGELDERRQSIITNAELSGVAVGNGFIKGLNKKESEVLQVVARLGTKILRAMNGVLVIQSPSKEAIWTGEMVGEGLIVGMSNAESTVATAAGSLGSTIGKAISQAIADEIGVDSVVSDEVQKALDRLYGVTPVTSGTTLAAGQLFAGLFGSQSGPGGRQNPLASLSDAFQGLRSGFDANVGRLFDAAGTEAGARNAAQRDIIGENVFGFDPTQVLGAANIANFTAVFDSIGEFAQTLIAQGTPLADVVAQVNDQIDSLIATAIELGFSESDVRALGEALGFSSDQLETFLSTVQDIGDAAATPSTPSPDATGGTGTDTGPVTLPRPIINNIYLPSGDPAAAALAVANAQAYSARLP